MKHVLKAFRVLLSEWRMNTKNWWMIREIVLMICNYAASPSLGGLAPVMAMMGREPMSPLSPMMIPGPRCSTTLAEAMKKCGQEIHAMRAALEGATEQVALSKAKKHSSSKAARNASARSDRFEVADYVVYLDAYTSSKNCKANGKDLHKW